LALFIAVSSLAAIAGASDPRVERAARALQKKAIEEDSLNVNYAAAAKKLEAALARCGADRCEVGLKAALLRDLGAMQLLAGNVDAGKASFAQSVALDGSLDLDPAYKNPMLEGIWADVKSKAGSGASRSSGAGGGAVAAGATGKSGAAGGDFVHTAPTEALVRTPLALYAEPPAGESLARVVVKYKSPGSSEWKSLRLKKMGDGFGGLIPCADVRPGTIEYFIQGFDAQDQPLAMSGSRTAPFAVEVKTALAGDVPALPGKSPPTQCKDKSDETECPPGFPGCKVEKKDVGDDCDQAAQCESGSCVAGKCAEATGQGKHGEGEACESDDDCSSGACANGACADKKGGGAYCESDDQCASGSCDDSKCTAPKLPYRRVWVGLAGQVDLYVLKSGTDLCLRNANTGAPANTAGYSCVDPVSNAQFPNNQVNNTILPDHGSGPGGTSGGFAFGNIRALATLDYALSAHMLIGGRVGYVARTDPAVGSPAAAFAPLHLEARFTYLIGGGLARGAVSLMAFGAAGVGEFDAYVPVKTLLSAPPPSNLCTTSETMDARTLCNENAWTTAGPFFGAIGAGARFRLGDAFAVPVAVKIEGAFGGAAGFLLGIAPELGIQYGF
jgi:hypothetical protein